MTSNCKSVGSFQKSVDTEFCTERANLFQNHKKLVSGATLEEVIGEGACGIVYKAIEKESCRTVAIKIVSYENESSAPYVLREAKIHFTLNHDNIIKLYKYYLKEKMLIMHMEYFAGVNLWQFVFNKEFHGKRHQVKNKILEGARRAIQYLQDLNVMHGDIHSRNVMVNCKGDVKMIDFGFAEWGATKKLDDLKDARHLYFCIENMNP